MPTVLLISEQERLRLLFTKLGKDGMFRLRVVPTLAQGEEEIAARLPHYVFVENHISGRPGAIIVPYLRTLLPEDAEVILMARDAADLDACREVGGLFALNLSAGDEALLRSVAEIVQRYTAPLESSHEPDQSAPKSARALLFGGSDREGTSAWLRRSLWIILLTLAVVFFSTLAYRAGKQSPHAAPPKVAGVAPVPSEVGRHSEKMQPPKDAGHRAAGENPVPSGAVRSPTGPNTLYRVRPGDNLLKVLVKDFGYTTSEAVGSIPDLKRLNNLSSLDRIKPGQVIIIPARQKAGRQLKSPGMPRQRR